MSIMPTMLEYLDFALDVDHAYATKVLDDTYRFVDSAERFWLFCKCSDTGKCTVTSNTFGIHFLEKACLSEIISEDLYLHWLNEARKNTVKPF